MFNKFHNEILELILIKCNYSTVSKVCPKWYDIVISKINEHKSNEIFFDLTKDDTKKIKTYYENEMFFIHKFIKNEYKIFI